MAIFTAFDEASNLLATGFPGEAALRDFDAKNFGKGSNLQKYAFSRTKYPLLNYDDIAKDNTQPTFPSERSPHSVAEALLWKLGKWEQYASFFDVCRRELVEDEFMTPEVEERYGDDFGALVLEQFAKHLARKNDEPILDQHSMRAGLLLMTARRELPMDHWNEIRHAVLTDGRNGKKWRGNNSNAALMEFIPQVKFWLKKKLGANYCHDTLVLLDQRMLFPLGKAIKSLDASLDTINRLAGCPL
jgi:hypothetical protein